MVRRGNDWLEAETGWLGPQPQPPQPRAAKPEVADQESEGDKLPVVLYVPVLCPHCASRDVLVTGTRARESVVRYHECRTCGGRFRSLERIIRR